MAAQLAIINDLEVPMRVRSCLKEDKYGYFIELKVYAKDIATLIRRSIIPMYDDVDNEFYIKVHINNVTQFYFNGKRVDTLAASYLQNFSIKRIRIEKAVFKPYSKNTSLSEHRACRAMVLDIRY